jgi:hypothetical protein
VIGPFGWTDNSDNEDGFRIYLQVPDLPPRLAGEFGANTSAASVGYTFEEHCLAHFWVVAFNDAGESAPSNLVRLPPPPSLCPGTAQLTYTNDGTAPADGLLIKDFLAYPLTVVRVLSHAPGCGAAEIVRDARDITVSWRTACVDPGESVTLEYEFLGPVAYGTSSWHYPTSPASPTVSPVPTIPAVPTTTPAALPNAGGAPADQAAPLLWAGLALLAGGVVLLSARGGTRNRG